MSKVRAIAFVLPQFHPILENDAWWGKGFTEWTNVKKAKPLFKGHYQPHVPTDLGYYDLRLPKAREAQAKIAKDHGIYGFCYYHYWFNGKRLLNYPIDEMLRLGEPDMPFMLCWANENWTRRWDGMDQNILIKQNYNFEDDANHMRWLCKHAFCDKRYIRIDDKPVFIIYRHDLFPDIQKTVAIWRDIAMKEYGLKGLYLCHTQSFNSYTNPNDLHLDAAIEFSPHDVLSHVMKKSLKDKLVEKLKIKKPSPISFRDFKIGVNQCIEREIPDYKLFRSVTPSFDNTPRKHKRGVVGRKSSPILYYKWLKHIVDNFQAYSDDENFIFINAMNEWGEGNHLEPCIKYKSSYLEATKKALS